MGHKTDSKKEKRGLSSCFQMPAAVMAGMSHMELHGNREVIVDGCGGILEYDSQTVRVKTGKLVAKFTGRDLAIKCLTADSLIVEGFITGIEFIT